MGVVIVFLFGAAGRRELWELGRTCDSRRGPISYAPHVNEGPALGQPIGRSFVNGVVF